jgi:peptidyl-prolyl cis-trans isomerase C
MGSTVVLLRTFLLLGVFAMRVSNAAAQAPSPAADPVVVRIGNTSLTASALQAEMARRGLTGPGVTLKHKQALVDELVRSESIAARAREAGYESRPDVQAALKQIIVDAYVREHLEPRLAAVTVADADVSKYYADHRADFTDGERRHTAFVKVAVPKHATAEARAAFRGRATEAAGEMAKTGQGPLGAVAVKYSDDQASRYAGGDMGWLSQGGRGYRWPAPVVEAAFALKAVGAVSAVVEAEDGFYVVKLLELVPSSVRSLEAVKAGVRQILLQERRAEIERALLQELRAPVKVTVDAEALAALAPPAGDVVEGERKPPPMPGSR